MSLAYVGSLGSSITTGTTATITVAKAVPAGAQVLVSGAANVGTIAPTVTDGRGNTYATTILPNSGAPIVMGYMAVATLATALQVNDVISIANGASVSKQAHVADAWTGLLDTAPADKSITASGTTGSPSPGATGTLAQADELIIVVVATNQLATGITTLAGYTAASQAGTTSGTNDRRISTFWRESSSTASTTPSVASLNSDGVTPTNNTWSAGLKSFKVNVTTPPPTGKQAYVWDGSTWAQKVIDVWDGNSWVRKSSITVY